MSKFSPLSDPELLAEAIKHSKSIKDVIVYLGLRAAGGNYKRAHYWSEVHGIPLPVFDYASQMRHYSKRKAMPDEHVFVANSSYTSRSHLKKRLIKRGWKYLCAECGLSDSWNGRPIVLHLDHINGVHNDNRLDNLRFLCPNCHSQTETYSGKKTRIIEAKGYKTRKPYPRKTKIDWPIAEEVWAAVQIEGYRSVGRRLGVSDTAIRKFLKRSDPRAGVEPALH